MLTINKDLWLSADQHFGHTRIHEFEPMRRDQAIAQGFDNCEELIIANHNAVVKPNDSVLFLGDFAFKNPLVYSKNLNGNKHLILGNHDRKGTQPYADFASVYRGVHVMTPMGMPFVHTNEDDLLSALIVPYEGKVLGFCHYAVGYDEEYDNNRVLILWRKEIIAKIFAHFGVTTVIHGHLHSKDSGLENYHNVCLERHNLTPVRLGDLL